MKSDPAETWGVLPMLCPYLSKHEDTEDGRETDNDESVDAFHLPFEVDGDDIVWNEASGRLAKSVQDLEDNWLIDLAVPCFGGFCAQDWADFVGTHNPNEQANADDWTQPKENEHKIFGCDLWFEVWHISLPGFGCEEEIDLMLVVDRSGSIGPTNMATVKTSLTAFVEALMPDASGNDNHVGLASFAADATLDEHLTDVKQDVLDAIDGLVSGGTTNLTGGITIAINEFDPIDPHERDSVQDIMLIITDGQPNVGSNPDAEAAAAAGAARAAGIKVFVVGIGAGVDEDYLKNEIADSPDQYFSAANFDELQAALLALTECDD